MGGLAAALPAAATRADADRSARGAPARRDAALLPSSRCVALDWFQYLDHTRAAAGGHIHCTARADDDRVVLELAADLADVERVNLLHLAADGTLLQRVRQLPVIGGREVVWASPGGLIRSLSTGVMFVRLMAVEPEGERLVGEYTLHHTAFRL